MGPHTVGRRFCAVQVFSPRAKTLAQGEFTSPEHLKTAGSHGVPAHHGRLGEIAQYPGMKAFFNLK